MSKYQKAVYQVQNQVTYIEQKIADANFTHFQYDYYVNVALESERKIKEKLKSGISKLLEARYLLLECALDAFKSKSMTIKSNIISPEQVVKMYFVEMTKPDDGKINARSMFDIKSEESMVKIDLWEDPLFGELAAEHLKPHQQVLEAKTIDIFMKGK